ncbi:AAA family ATPase [Thermodesulfobacteriota bacterium]
MHLRCVEIHSEKFPGKELYPFNLSVFRKTKRISFDTPTTFFVGENGTGKSTLLKALALKCGIQIWSGVERSRFERSPYEKSFHRFVRIEWTNGRVPGSFFASEIFQNFAQLLDEWATTDPGVLEYFGGSSLMTQSHGQSLMSFFQSRYQIKGLYLLDEPETALSPRSQLNLMKLIRRASAAGHAQFVIITHSPILLALPEARIYSFDSAPVKPIDYEETEYYQVFKSFMEDRKKYLDD